MGHYKHIVFVDGAVAEVILNRPQVRNSLNAELLSELTDVFSGLRRQRDLRCVVLRALGSDFCAGADANWLKEGGRLTAAEGARDARKFAEMLDAVDICPVPVIAAAQGGVFGGGLGLLAAADIALVADNAKLCFSECRLGIMPAVISCWVLPKIGAANARRYYLTAEVFGAHDALRMGLVSEVVAAGDLSDKTETVVADILRCGPEAVRAAKRVIPQLIAARMKKRVDLATKTLSQLRSSPEGQEGLSAFLEKRTPKWSAKS